MKILTPFLGALCLLSVFTACFAWGQATNSSEVTGSVTDPTGAIVPGVTVTVKDIDKNTERTFTTNDSGVYDTGPLVPTDHYLLIFRKEGFTTMQRGPLTLSTGVTGMNIQLSLGQSNQQVVVQTEAAPLLETTTAEISQTVPQETLKVLPQTGGIPDWQAFLTFLPGPGAMGPTTTAPTWEACL